MKWLICFALSAFCGCSDHPDGWEFQVYEPIGTSKAWMAKKYGKLPKEWKPYIHDGFQECLRVLKQNGTLIFKWSEIQIPVKDVIDAIGVCPLYGHRSGRASKTHWMAFVKFSGGVR